jgi:chromosome segregation ATPase
MEKKIKEDVTAKENELAKLEEEKKELGKLTKEQARKAETLEQSNVQLTRHLRHASLKDINIQLADELNAKIFGLEAEKKDLESDKRDLEKKLRDATKRIEELESENSTLAEKMKQQTARAAQKEEKLKKKLEALGAQAKELQDKLDDALRKLNKPKEDVKLIALSLESPVGTSERKTRTTLEVPQKDARFNESLLTEPGSERARYCQQK